MPQHGIEKKMFSIYVGQKKHLGVNRNFSKMLRTNTIDFIQMHI